MNRGYDEGALYKDGYERSVHCLYLHVPKNSMGSDVHFHDYIEILYGVDCDMTVWINDETVHFETGDIVIINPLQTHFLKSHGKDSEYIVIKFSKSILEGQMPPEAKYMLPLLNSAHHHGNIIKKSEMKDDEIEKIAVNIYNEYVAEKFGYEIAIRSGILNLYLNIVRIWNEKKVGEKLFGVESSVVLRMYQAAESVSKNFSDITEEDVAKEFSMSYSYFSRCFKKVLGISFSKYLNDVRIDNARKMLLTTDKSVTDIAVEVGFSSASHFIYAFRNRTGVSPLVYKKEFKKFVE